MRRRLYILAPCVRSQVIYVRAGNRNDGGGGGEGVEATNEIRYNRLEMTGVLLR